MNVKLLRRVAKHILAEPKRLRMSNWIASTKPRLNRNMRITGEYFDFSDFVEGPRNDYGEPTKQKIPNCGTVACIAGWSCVLGTRGKLLDGVRPVAQDLLGISQHQADSLFYVQRWPENMRRRYIEAKNVRQRAKLVAEVIEDFIKTGE